MIFHFHNGLVRQLLTSSILRLFPLPRLITVWLSASFIQVHAASVQEQEAEAARRLTEFVQSPRFEQAQWGGSILALPEGRTVWEWQPRKLFKPASTAKLFSAGLALKRFGPDYQVRTSLYSQEPPDHQGVLHGDLLLYGRGDPSFAARFFTNDYARGLEVFVAAVKKAGIRRIEGDLIGDDSEFVADPFGSGWTWDDLQYYYGAEVSALTLQDNVVDLTFRPGARAGDPVTTIFRPATDYLSFENRVLTVVSNAPRSVQITRLPGSRVFQASGSLPVGAREWGDAVTVPEPSLWFAHQLILSLKLNGVEVKGKARARHSATVGPEAGELAGWVEVASVQGAPMREVVRHTLKASQNLYAQLLLLQAGVRRERLEASRSSREVPLGEPWAYHRKSTAIDTQSFGLRDLKDWLKEIDIPSGDVLMDEGSGLSRSALLTPQSLGRLLLQLHRSEHSKLVFESLPVAGVDGTLRARLTSGPARSLLRAKTGTLAYVSTLAGYLPAGGGRTYAFCLLLNQYSPRAGGKSVRSEVDAAAELMTAALTGGPGEPSVSSDKP